MCSSDLHVDLRMAVTNLTGDDWHDVFSLNCLNPVRAPEFKDWKLTRTFVSVRGRPTPLARTTRNPGWRPTVGIYLPEGTPEGHEPPFAAATGGISHDRTDADWIATCSDPPGSYIAATSSDALFLFNNQDRCCIHSATSFGTIPAGQSRTTISRLHFARGDLDDFLDKALQPDVASR